MIYHDGSLKRDENLAGKTHSSANQNSLATKTQSQSQKKKSARSFLLFMFSRSRFKLSVSGWFGQYFIRIGYQNVILDRSRLVAQAPSVIILSFSAANILTSARPPTRDVFLSDAVVCKRDGFQMAAGWMRAGLLRPGRRLKAPEEGNREQQRYAMEI